MNRFLPIALLTLLTVVSAPLQAAASSPSKLGDLSAYRTIVTDVTALIDKSDFAGAKTRITDLEKLWDHNEASLKPKDPPSWHTLDKAIDEALHQVRLQKPVAADCQKALQHLLDLIDHP
jgi:hypothetical protein